MAETKQDRTAKYWIPLVGVISSVRDANRNRITPSYTLTDEWASTIDHGKALGWVVYQTLATVGLGILLTSQLENIIK